MATETIRRILDTFVVAPGAVVRRGLRAQRGHDVLVGPGAHVVGNVVGARNIHLARGAVVAGRADAELDVVVGAQAQVRAVEAGGNVYLLSGARVRGDVRARGSVRIVGARVDGRVEAGGDVEVGGDAVLHELRPGGRVRTMPAGEGDPAVTDS